ncbi:MAG: TldD/PmbA family protein, partial [Candidatus Eiseniibacteriota bacterium]
MSASVSAPGAVGRPPISPDEARGLLDEALAMSAAERTLAVLEAHDESLTRFANNEIHQNVTSRRHTLTLQAVVGRRSGTASVDRLDSSALRQVADRALALARLSPEDEGLPEAAPPAEVRELAGYVPATAACTPEERAAAVEPVLSAAGGRGLNAAGALTTGSSVLAVATTLGQFAYHPDSYSRFTCTVRSADSSGWVDRHRRDWRALEAGALGQVAIEKAERSRDPAEITPGRHTVVLEPAAVADLVAFLAWLGLGAQSEQEGRSFLSGRMGERITGAGVTLVDDAFDPRSFGRPFDHEGTPRRRMALIDGGIARAVVHDRRTARAAGIESTGHASPPPAVDGPIPYDLVLATGDRSLDELIASTERGILVTRLWYNRVVDARRTLVTGMTRDGTFLIEGGRLTRGLKNLRFIESVLEVLERAEGTGREAEPTVFD